MSENVKIALIIGLSLVVSSWMLSRNHRYSSMGESRLYDNRTGAIVSGSPSYLRKFEIKETVE